MNYIRIQQALSNQGEILSHSAHTRALSLNPLKWLNSRHAREVFLPVCHLYVMSFIFLLFALFFTFLSRKPKTGAWLELRMTTPPLPEICCFFHDCSNGSQVHFPKIFNGAALPSPKDYNLPLSLHITSVLTNSTEMPSDCSRSRKNSKQLCDIEGLLERQPIFIQRHLLTHFSHEYTLHL